MPASRLAILLASVAILGFGCAPVERADVTVSAGDTLVVRQTVLGIGGKLAELAGVTAEERELTVPSVWPTAATTVDDDAFVLLPKETYAELVETGSARISLGLYDQAISDALGLVDRLAALAALIGVKTDAGDMDADVLRVELTAADATDWVRVDGKLEAVKSVEASNAFASYVILANQESPLILSLTLKPAARAQFDALKSFEGFEVSEIRHK
jgi:hypothetical protein